MLKKLPNFLRKLSLQKSKISLNTNYTNSKISNTSNNINLENNSELSFSLYDSVSDKKSIKNIIAINSIFLSFFLILFLVSFYLNYVYLDNFNTLRNNITLINNLSDTEREYNSLANSIVLYKDLQESSIKLYPYLSAVLSVIPDNLELQDLDLTHDKFEITLISEKLLNFSFLLEEYLNNPYISIINLQDVTLVPNQNGNELYSIKLNGEFK